MKSKKSLYALLAAVIIIWGVIIYRILANVSFSTDVQQSANTVIETVNEQVQLDSFSILANYRDPFLDKYVKKETKTIKTTVSKVKKVIVPKVEKTIQPKYNIRYKGIIANKKSALAVLMIDGKELLMQKNDKYKDLTVLKIAKDSVLLTTSDGNFYVKRK